MGGGYPQPEGGYPQNICSIAAGGRVVGPRLDSGGWVVLIVEGAPSAVGGCAVLGVA